MKSNFSKVMIPVLAGMMLVGCRYSREFDSNNRDKMLSDRGGIVPPPVESPRAYQQKNNDDLAIVAQPDIGEEEVLFPVAPVPTQKYTPPANLSKGTPYVVKKGDTLSGIAHANSLTTRDLAEYNKISLNSIIRVDQVLELPAHAKAKIGVAKTRKPTAKTTTSVTSTKSNSTDNYKPRGKEAMPADGKYTVKSGDNLSVIANRFGVSINNIRNANNLKSDNLKIGQVLALKGGAAKTTTANPVNEKVTVPVTPQNPDVIPAPNSGEVVAEEVKVEVIAPVTEVTVDEYVCVGNETLESLATLYGVQAEEINKLNPGVNWGALTPGQQIKVIIK